MIPLKQQPNPYWHITKAERKAIKAQLDRKGIKPTKKQWVVCIETTAIKIPAWARERAHKEFSQGPNYAWFRGRGNMDAKELEWYDRQAGGSPMRTLMEWRRCPNCGRILVSLLAQARRRLEESGRFARNLPCSGECHGG